jgi:hypothetical protein
MAASPNTVFEGQIDCELGTDPGKSTKKNNQDGGHFRFHCWSLGTPQIHQNSSRSRQFQNI